MQVARVTEVSERNNEERAKENGINQMASQLTPFAPTLAKSVGGKCYLGSKRRWLSGS